MKLAFICLRQHGKNGTLQCLNARDVFEACFLLSRRGGIHNLLIGFVDQVKQDKFVTGVRQRQRRFGLAHTQHIFLLLPQTHRQTGKITVTRDQTKAVYLILIEQIHRVNDHCNVRAVLSARIGKLLNGHDGVLQ